MNDRKQLRDFYSQILAAGGFVFSMPPGRWDRPPAGWNGGNLPSLNLDQVLKHLEAGLNIGVSPPPGGIVVDADTADAYQRVADDMDGATLIVKTPRGYHLWYLSAGAELCSMAQVAGQTGYGKGIDIRLPMKGYVVGPGSVVDSSKWTGKGEVIPDDRGYVVVTQEGRPFPEMRMLPEAMRRKLMERKSAAKPKIDKPEGGPKNAVQVDEGQRNDTLTKWTGIILNTDMVLEDARACAVGLGKLHMRGLPDEEIAATVESVISKELRDHPERAINRKARVYWPDPTSTENDIGRRLEAIGVKCRWNSREDREEVKYLYGWKNAEPHRAQLLSQLEMMCISAPFYDRAHNRLRGLAHKRYTTERFNVYFEALCKRRREDPFLLWLKNLAPWDCHQRLDRCLETLFQVPKEDQPVARHAFFATMLACVHRAHTPGYKYDTVLQLISPEGEGKSTLFKHLFPPEYQGDWFHDDLDFSASGKEQIENLAGHVIVEASEGVGLARADRERLKSFITRTTDKTRLAYGRKRTDKPRMMVIVGTSNKHDLPVGPDERGRRWMPVKVERRAYSSESQAKSIMRYMEENREKLWAEACFWHSEGKECHIPEGLEKIMSGRVQAYRTRDDYLEEKLSNILERETLSTAGVSQRALAEEIEPHNPRRVMNMVGRLLLSWNWMRSENRQLDPITGAQTYMWYPPGDRS